jgi:hypothetical protein
MAVAKVLSLMFAVDSLSRRQASIGQIPIIKCVIKNTLSRLYGQFVTTVSISLKKVPLDFYWWNVINVYLLYCDNKTRRRRRRNAKKTRVD